MLVGTETTNAKLETLNPKFEVPPSFQTTLELSFNKLWEWCREQNFSGHDPFDALNSRLFQTLPLSKTRFARLAWTQLLKRSPINLRNIASVPKEKNSKGIALFALAALARHRTAPTPTTETDARALLDILLEMKVNGWSGAAWGYNFDWQSRYFFAPRGWPTIVPTAFGARALTEAHEVFSDKRYLEEARSVCEFILRDLPRPIDSSSELCFSYTPGANTRIFNASLLAAETLQIVGAKTNENGLLTAALRATRYVVNHQRSNGAWAYGEAANQSWVDNFHTAFVLGSLARINQSMGIDTDGEFASSLARGYEYWRTRFFLADGWPKYYDDALFPADVHSAAAAIVALCDMNAFKEPADRPSEQLGLAKEIARWSVANLLDLKGYFYYQRRRFYTVRTPFMRWNQAWMSYALARLLEET